MSDTPISPAVGALAASGVALSFGLGLAPLGGGVGVSGLAPTATAVAPVVSREGRPLSWSALAAGAAGASVGPFAWQQARFQVSGQFGSNCALVIQGSADGLTWVNLAAVTGASAAGAALPSAFAGAPYGGLTVTALSGGIVLSAREDRRYPYLRAAVQGGDGTTSLNVTGNISNTGCV